MQLAQRLACGACEEPSSAHHSSRLLPALLYLNPEGSTDSSACGGEAGTQTVTRVAGGTGTDLHSKQVPATARALVLFKVFKL